MKNNILAFGDCNEILSCIEKNSVDLVLTDPPYNGYRSLADLCPPLMKNGTSLITFTEHCVLEDAVSAFRDRLNYHWLLAVNRREKTRGGIEIHWRPALWYVKSYHGGGALWDMITADDFEWCVIVIENLTRPGDTVLDPFLGSGTVALAAIELDRHFIGIENDQYTFATAVSRIDDAGGNAFEAVVNFKNSRG